MKAMVWFIALAAIAGVVYGLWRARARWEERKQASEERLTSFMLQAMPKTTPAPQASHDTVVQQRLLLEAASKAGEAGEPALSIQLYARLLSRYPQSSFAEQARAAVEAQKKKLAPRPS